MPSTNSLAPLPVGTPGSTASPCSLPVSSSYCNIGASGNYVPPMPTSLAPPPIMPGSALRLLHQGRAQGLFTPSTSALNTSSRAPGFASPSFSATYGHPLPSQTPPPGSSLKRNRSEADVDNRAPNQFTSPFPSASLPLPLDSAPDIYTNDRSRPSSTTPANGEEGPSPSKRARRESPPRHPSHSSWQLPPRGQTQSLPLLVDGRSTLQSGPNGVPPPLTNIAPPGSSDLDIHAMRFSTKPLSPRPQDPSVPLRDGRRAAVIAAICQRDDPTPVLDLLREISPEVYSNSNTRSSTAIDVDTIIDDQGHTALHIAASLARYRIVDALIAHGADIHRGNYLGETPLTRACIATHNADQQAFDTLVSSLHPSIRTLDTSRKSVLHHIVSLAGVNGRAVAARYYLDQIFYWIAQHQGGDFKSLVDLQDEHGDTALNIAARVGNRSLVRTLLDVGANRTLPNKLGLKPGDFGVETEVCDYQKSSSVPVTKLGSPLQLRS
jgi:regulatory protein SWI6